MTSHIHATKVTSPTFPPFVVVDGIPNFRDLGGYPVTQSANHSVKRGAIFRCGEPQAVTKDGIQKMTELGITHVYDLRSRNEIERSQLAGRGGVAEWDGCKRVFAPVFVDQAYDPEGLAVRFKDYTEDGTEGFTRAYISILEAAATTSYRTILLHLAHEPEEPLIVHCTAGKDRTGVICALVLSLCGVDDETVANEYQLTECGMPEVWKKMVIAHLMANPALVGNYQGAVNMISARAENMLAVLRTIKEKYGSVESYMTNNCGLTKDEVEKIRANLVVEVPPTQPKSA